MAVAGSHGDSLLLRGRPQVIDLLFAATTRAHPRGGYVRLYPLGPDGFVGLPGRFYPATTAVCLGWDQSRPPRDCRRAPASLASLLRPALRLSRFDRGVTTVGRLTNPRLGRPGLLQLEVVFELAFDRSRLARSVRRPAACLPFVVKWSGPAARLRPSHTCLSPRGLYARGRLYPLGPAPWRLARANLRTQVGTAIASVASAISRTTSTTSRFAL